MMRMRKPKKRKLPRVPAWKARGKKREFSKFLAAWACLIATAVIVASVTLAAYEKYHISDLSISVFTGCIGFLITYAGKSAYEKSSRNRYGIDGNGRPFKREATSDEFRHHEDH